MIERDELIKEREELIKERDEALAGYHTRGKMLVRVLDRLICVRDELDDQGDLVAFGSTNHADIFRDAVEEMDNEGWRVFLAQEGQKKDEPDYIAVNRKLRDERDAAIARAEKLIKERDELRRTLELGGKAWAADAQLCTEAIDRMKAAIARAEKAEVEIDETARVIGDFMLVPPDGGDVKLHEGAQAMKDALAPAPKAPSAEGWRMVPVEPTAAMLASFHSGIEIEVRPDEKTASVLNDKHVWANFLAAAPLSPAPPMKGE